MAWAAANRDPLPRKDPEELSRSLRVIEIKQVDVVPRAVGYGSVQPARVWQAVAEGTLSSDPLKNAEKADSVVTRIRADNRNLSAGDIKNLLSLAPIKQYQFIQTELEAMEVRLATTREVTAEEEAAVAAFVRGKFGEGFAVAFRYYDEIPRTPAGKFEDFVCRVPA